MRDWSGKTDLGYRADLAPVFSQSGFPGSFGSWGGSAGQRLHLPDMRRAVGRTAVPEFGSKANVSGGSNSITMNDSTNGSLEIAIVDEPIRFQLYGLSSKVENRRYGEVGIRLMNKMWKVVKEANLATTGINHWVYFADDWLLVGVEFIHAEQVTIPESLEPCEFELKRYAKHVHIGPYQELPQKWQALKAELSTRGESIRMPSLEVYGHSCEGNDESKATTTILMSVEPKAT